MGQAIYRTEKGLDSFPPRHMQRFYPHPTLDCPIRKPHPIIFLLPKFAPSCPRFSRAAAAIRISRTNRESRKPAGRRRLKPKPSARRTQDDGKYV